MTYCYALNGDSGATIYRAKGDGEFVAEAEILGSGDIAAIARATVATLSGTTANCQLCDVASEFGKQANVRINAETVRYLASGKQLCVNDDVTISGASDIASVWHPKAVEALRAIDAELSGRHFAHGPEGNEAEAFMKPSARAAWRLVREALALVDQPPPAEKVVGWALMDNSNTPLLASIYDSLSEAQQASKPAGRFVSIVRLVEEPTS